MVGSQCHGAGGSLVSLPRTAPNKALEPTAYSFGSATLRLRFRRRLTASVRLQWEEDGRHKTDPRR